MILRCFHQSVLRCRSKLQEQREPARCKGWQREQRSGAGVLVKCLPTVAARSATKISAFDIVQFLLPI